MRAIAKMYEHSYRQGFDLDGCLTLKKFEASSFVSFLQSLFVYLQTGISNSTVAGAIHSTISPGTFAGHWNSIKQYIRHWIEQSLMKNKVDNRKMIEELSQGLLFVDDKLNQFVSKMPPQQYLPILDDNELSKVIKAFHPTSDTFKDEIVKWRNWTMFLTMLDAGIRVGSLLNLYIEDTPQGGNDKILKIKRRPDNPKDPRRRKPQVKTINYKVAISDRTISTMSKYITDFRADYAGAPFLFLDEDNKRPVAYATIKSAFDKVSNITGINVTPHDLRRTRHYNRLLELGLEQKDLVRQEGGWSPRSGIPEAYIFQYKLDQSNKTASFFLPNLIERVTKNDTDDDR